MRIRLTPASEDRRVWVVFTPKGPGEAPVDYTTLSPEQRSFVGDDGGYFDAEPAAEGWELKRRLS